jgi:hypothetical protein
MVGNGSPTREGIAVLSEEVVPASSLSECGQLRSAVAV